MSLQSYFTLHNLAIYMYLGTMSFPITTDVMKSLLYFASGKLQFQNKTHVVVNKIYVLHPLYECDPSFCNSRHNDIGVHNMSALILLLAAI